jgi:TrmH family RNA methyltransferase
LPNALQSRVRIVLVRPRNPLNIGAVARAMSNFGFSQLRVVNPYEVAFREARSAVGASAVLHHAQEYKAVPEAVADCSLIIGTTALGHRQSQHAVMRLDQSTQLMLVDAAPLALLFGSEKVGLSNEDLSYCHSILRIPTRGENLSMNLGQAVAVCLYEIIREPNVVLASGQREPATGEELERITGVLSDALRTSGYTKKGALRSTTEKVRRLVYRLNLSSNDAELLLGMLRKISRRE